MASNKDVSINTMRQIFILVFTFIFVYHANAQIQVTVNLARDSGVKRTEHLYFSISSKKEVVYNFHYDKFSNVSPTSTDLYQHNAPVHEGNYKLSVSLEKEEKESILDSLIIDGSIARVEIFILVSTDYSSDYIKEIKLLYFKKTANNIKFSINDTLKVGSKASFRIQNQSDKSFVGYPNNGFFFGTLYENIHNDSWTQHYPINLNYNYCDTISKSKSLLKGQQTIAWTPNDNDCSEYVFVKNGNYFFQLLYSEQNTPTAIRRNRTNIIILTVYREIFLFTI
jgi:hypothetical protein